MPDSNLPFGIDLSKHNTSADGKKKVDFDIIAAYHPRVEFVAMRAGVSWAYQDPWYQFYFDETLRIFRTPMPYHVLYPGQPALRQMDNFFRILGEIDFSNTPLVLDLELDHGQTVSTITATTAASVDIITKRTGRSPIIYSRALWVNQFLRVSALPPVHWWLAQYLYSRPYPLYTPEKNPPPLLPVGVANWRFHQTTQRGRSIGAPALYYMDYNRFNGSMYEFQTFVNIKAPELAICPLDGVPCGAGKTVAAAADPVHRTQLQKSPAGGGGSTAKPAVEAALPAWLGHKQNHSRINLKK